MSAPATGDRVSKTVQQALLTAIAMYFGRRADRLFRAPFLLDFANASPEVQALALPFLRVNFTFSIGMLLVLHADVGAARRR